MDKLPLKTYYFGDHIDKSMKQAASILLTSLLLLNAAGQLPALAKGRHTVRRGSGGGGGSGVVLQTPTPQTPIEHNNRGVELGSRGLWPDAIKEHEMALAAQPWNKEFRTNLSGAQLRYGNVLFKQGKFYEAIKEFRGALFVDPDNLPADDSLDECYRRLHKDPLNVAIRRAMAEDFDVKGQYEDGIVEYRKVVKMSDSGKSHADLGYVLFKAGKYVDGFQELRISVQKPWNNDEITELAAVHRKMAETLTEYAYKARDRGMGTLGMKRLANAATEYKRAVTLNPADAQAIQGFIEVVRECAAIKPSFDNYLMLGGGYLLAHDFAHAKMCYEQCYKIDPRRPELAQARVAYHQAVARWPSASEEQVADSVVKVQKFLENDPDNPRWYYILGRLKQHQGDTDGAMEAYRRAEKINHLVDPDLEQQIKVLGGSPEYPTFAGTQGSGSGAAPAAGAAGAPAIASAAGVGGSGNAGAAAPAPVKSSLDPRNMATYAKVEELMSQSPDQALQIIDDLLQKNPQDGHAWFLKGTIQRKQGSLDESAADFRMAAGLKDSGAQEALDQINTIRIQENVQRADQYIESQNWVKAADELDEAVAKAPNLPFLHHKLAEVMRHMNDTASATKEEQKATELESTKKK